MSEATTPTATVNLVNVWTPTLRALHPLLSGPVKAEGKAATQLKALARRGLATETDGTYAITGPARTLLALLWGQSPDASGDPAVNLNDLPAAKFDALYAMTQGPVDKKDGVLVKRNLAAQDASGTYKLTAFGGVLADILWPGSQAAEGNGDDDTDAELEPEGCPLEGCGKNHKPGSAVAAKHAAKAAKQASEQRVSDEEWMEKIMNGDDE